MSRNDGVNVGVGGPHHGHGGGHHGHHGGGFSTFQGPFYEAPVYCPPPSYPQPIDCIPSLQITAGSPFGDILPKTAVDVMQLQAKYDPDFDAVSAAVAQCASAKMQGPSSGWLPAQMQADFTSFYLGWKSYVSDANKAGITGVADDNYQLGLSMIQELNLWRDIFTQAGCTFASVPKIVPPPPPDAGPSFSSFTWPIAIGAVALAAIMIFRK
jgi:hypothetical protein